MTAALPHTWRPSMVNWKANITSRSVHTIIKPLTVFTVIVITVARLRDVVGGLIEELAQLNLPLGMKETDQGA